jgi:hypothetical protein
MLTVGSKGRSRTIDYFLGRRNIKDPAFFSELDILMFGGLKAQLLDHKTREIAKSDLPKCEGRFVEVCYG